VSDEKSDPGGSDGDQASISRSTLAPAAANCANSPRIAQAGCRCVRAVVIMHLCHDGRDTWLTSNGAMPIALIECCPRRTSMIARRHRNKRGIITIPNGTSVR